MPNKKQHSGLKILYGLIIGAALGVLLNRLVDSDTKSAIIKYVTAPVGTIFLRSLFMIVLPLVFSSLAAGVASLASAKDLKRLGLRIGLFYFFTTLTAVMIGQALTLTIQPGAGLDQNYVNSSKAALAEQTKSLADKSSAVGNSLWPGLVDTIIPKNIVDEFAKNNMLALIFVSIVFGISLLALPNTKSEPIVKTLQTISDCSAIVVKWIMSFAPFAVAALVMNAVAVYDFAILKNVGLFFIVVVTGYLLHFFGTYSLILKFLIGFSPKEFYIRFWPVVATAFGTSSSNATLPTNMNILETRFNVPEKITNFTLPLGSTVNMDGTALFEVVTALFIAQVFGIDLSFVEQFTLVTIVILTSVGVAGVPGGSIPLLMSAMAFVGIPAEGIALVLGVDRLLDMGRTVVNVTGDAVGTLYVAKLEGVNLTHKAHDNS